MIKYIDQQILSLSIFFSELKFNNLLIWGFNTILIIGCSLYLPISFETNDDALMMLLASGQYTGTHEYFLAFINVIYGFLLSSCYKIWPQIQWYSVLFLIFHLFSLNVLSKNILIQRHSLKAKILFLSILYLIAIHNIVSFQFTTTAAITALAGLILIEEKNKNVKKWAGVLLFIFASLIRFEAAFLVLIVYSPQFYLIAFRFIKSIIKQRKFNKKFHIIGYLLITVMVSFLLRFANSEFCKNSDLYSYYYKYNSIRGKIHDNPQAQSAINNLPAGISKLDYQLFNESIIDINIFSLSKIEEINNSIKEVKFIEKLEIGLTNLYKHNAKFLICILCITLIIIQINHAKSRKIIMRLSLILFLLVAVLIALDGIYKYRVFISALLPLFFVIIQNFNSSNYKFSVFSHLLFILVIFFCFTFLPSKFILIILILFVAYIAITYFKAPLINYTIFIFTLIFAMLLLDKLTWDKKNHANKQKKFMMQQNMVSKAVQQLNKSVFPLPKNFIIDAINPVSIDKIPNINQIIFSGWMAGYPDKIHTLKSLNRLLENSCFLLAKSDQNRVFEVQQFVKEHYQKEFNAKIVLEFDDFCIVDFSLSDNNINKIK